MFKLGYLGRRNRPFQFLNLDSRSGTDYVPSYGIKILYTVESLILAQDER